MKNILIFDSHKAHLRYEVLIRKELLNYNYKTKKIRFTNLYIYTTIKMSIHKGNNFKGGDGFQHDSKHTKNERCKIIFSIPIPNVI